MEIISPRNNSKFLYDKFNSKILRPDDLLMINQFHKTDYYFLTLQQYEVSGEWIIWVSSDLFAELQFDDVWLIFPRSEKVKAKSVFATLKERLESIYRQKTPRLLREKFNLLIEGIEKESKINEKIPALV